MADTKARKRLKKLASSSSSSPEPDQDFIPKKSGTSITKESINKLVKSTETNKEFEDDSSLDDFITDKVEYDRYGPPVSSSESAHSTDEEGIARKIKRKRVSSPSEESASESSSISAKSFSETEEANESEEPKRILVGKQALEDKRARGLIPGAVKKIKSEKSEKKKKKEKKKEKKAEKYKEVLEKPKKEKKRDDGKKYIQFKEYSSREEREKAEIVTKIMCRWWYIAGD